MDPAIAGVASLAEAARISGAASFSLLGAGEDYRVFSAGGRVFRFPQRAECADWLEVEARLLPRLAGVLAVAIPSVELQPSPASWREQYSIYPLLPGQQASELPPASLLWLAPLVGDLLARLHALPIHLAKETGVRENRAIWAPEVYHARAAAEYAAPPVLEGPLRAAVERFLAGPVHLARGPVRLIHGDLEAEHLLVDASARRLTGVLDWSDATIADPARDFGALWAWGGRQFFAELMKTYGAAPDREFAARVQFLGRVFAIFDLLEAGDEGPPQRDFAVAQLERAFDPAERLA